MNRLAGIAFVMVSAVPALAGNPVPGPAQPTWNRPVNHLDVTAPLSTAMAAAPTTNMTANPYCADGSCGAGGCRPDRPLVSKLRDWLFFQPGPRCAPTFVTAPDQAPVWAYVHCRSECLCIVGGCPSGNCGCPDGSCGPRLRGYGLAARGMIGERADCGACNDSFLARLFGRSRCKYGPPSGCWPGNEFTSPVVNQAYGGSTLSPVSGVPASNGTGVRFASPNTVPLPVQQSAYRPFTNP